MFLRHYWTRYGLAARVLCLVAAHNESRDPSLVVSTSPASVCLRATRLSLSPGFPLVSRGHAMGRLRPHSDRGCHGCARHHFLAGYVWCGSGSTHSPCDTTQTERARLDEFG